MPVTRALLTDNERSILSGEKDVSDEYYAAVKHHVKNRFENRLEKDVDILQKHEEDLWTKFLHHLR